MPDKTITAANQLADALHENTEELREVKDQLTSVKTRFWIVAGCLVATVCLLVFSFYSRYDQRVAACERDNDLRAANTQLWQPVLDQSPPPEKPGPDATNEEIAEYQRDVKVRELFQKTLDEGFAQRDCDDISWL